jgi:hypothetical protein
MTIVKTMVSLTAGCETIGFLTFYFRKRKNTMVSNNFVNTKLMKPLVFSYFIIKIVENTMVSSSLYLQS